MALLLKFWGRMRQVQNYPLQDIIPVVKILEKYKNRRKKEILKDIRGRKRLDHRESWKISAKLTGCNSPLTTVFLYPPKSSPLGLKFLCFL
jgi:hypothetical protein